MEANVTMSKMLFFLRLQGRRVKELKPIEILVQARQFACCFYSLFHLFTNITRSVHLG